MLVVLPALFFLLTLVAAASRVGLRQGFVIATLIYTTSLVVATELLSIPDRFGYAEVAVFWSGAAALAALWLWRRGDGETLMARLRGARGLWVTRRPELVGIAIVLAVVGAIGVLSPPNNPGSLGYRMMRVAIWLQQGSVDHYATPFVAQLYHAPLGSWHIAHLQLLAGGDRFANAPEWLALAGCATVASLIARELKGSFAVQVLAATLAATVPSALLAASSTMQNLLAAYWLLCFVLLFVQHLRAPALWRLGACGAALGFALLAKPTAYVLGPPLVVVLGLYGAFVWRRPVRTAGALAAIGLLAVLVNVGPYARNWELFGHPVAPPGEETHINARFGLDILGANLLRNSLLHWGLPHGGYNAALLATVDRVLGGLPEPPEATMGRTLTEYGIWGRFNEALASNLLHYWLLAASAAGLLLVRRRIRPRRAAVLAIYLLAAWLLAVLAFSGLLRWEWGNTRYDVPLFMLGCPLAAVFLAAAFGPRAGRGGAALRVAAAVFLVASVPWLLLKESAPVLKLPFYFHPVPAETIFAATRERAYFNGLGNRFNGVSDRGNYLVYTALADAIADLEPDAVGLHYAFKSPFAYPLYMMLRARLPDVRLAYYDVRHNPSAALASESWQPAVVVNLNQQVARDRMGRVRHRSRGKVRGEGSIYRTHLEQPNGALLLRRVDSEASQPRPL